MEKRIHVMDKNGNIKLGRYYSIDILDMLIIGDGKININYQQPNNQQVNIMQFGLTGPYRIILDGVNLECPHQICKVNIYKKKTGYVMKIKPAIG